MKENTGAVHAQVPVEVASFLLNEKRGEIQKLEARLKVNIILVPNSHLETPHYKVQRLKHDELNQMEHVPASYELVERPEEAQAIESASEQRRERQEAAVKAITPDQPAPMVPEPVRQPAPAEAPRPEAKPAAAEAPKPGFFGRLLGWLKSEKPAGETQVAPAANDATRRAAQEQRREPQGERRPERPRRGEERYRDRDRGRGGRDRDRGGRGERRDDRPREGGGRHEQRGGERRDERRDDRGREGGGRHGEQRGERREGQRPEERRPQQGQPRLEQGRPGEGRPQQQREEGDEQRRGRRGRRGGRDRDRRPGGEWQERRPGGEQAAHQAPQGAEHPVPQMAEQPTPFERPAPESRPMPAAEQPVAVAAAVPEVREPPRRPEPAPQIEAPRVDPKEYLQGAGLQMVETRSDAGRAAEPAEEPVKLGRPRRERPPVAAEELVQVETQK
jgi:ribonuclease E